MLFYKQESPSQYGGEPVWAPSGIFLRLLWNIYVEEKERCNEELKEHEGRKHSDYTKHKLCTAILHLVFESPWRIKCFHHRLPNLEK